MPLMHKESQKAFKHNVKEEMEAHPSKRAQNLAIAYAIKRRAEKEHEAHGGEMHMCSGGGCEHPSHKMAEGGEAPIKGHGRLGVEFDPTLPPRKGYPKNAAEQYENLKSEHARVSEMSKRDRAMKAFNGKKMAEGP